MTVKLLTEHHLEFLSFKGGCTGSSESILCQNATFLEITCRGSIIYTCITDMLIEKLLLVFIPIPSTLCGMSINFSRYKLSIIIKKIYLSTQQAPDKNV